MIGEASPSQKMCAGVILAVAFMVIGCSATPGYRRIPHEASAAAYHEPPAERLLRFEQPAALEGTFWKNDSLFLTFSNGRKNYYGRVSADNQVNLSIHQEWFPVYQINPLGRQRFDDAIGHAEPVRHLDRYHWEALIERIENTLVIRIRPETGILVNIRDEELFFLSAERRIAGRCPAGGKPSPGSQDRRDFPVPDRLSGTDQPARLLAVPPRFFSL